LCCHDGAFTTVVIDDGWYEIVHAPDGLGFLDVSGCFQLARWRCIAGLGPRPEFHERRREPGSAGAGWADNNRRNTKGPKFSKRHSGQPVSFMPTAPDRDPSPSPWVSTAAFVPAFYSVSDEGDQWDEWAFGIVTEVWGQCFNRSLGKASPFIHFITDKIRCLTSRHGWAR
jgi:hypothetical protein